MEFGYVRGRVRLGVTFVDIMDVPTAMINGVQRTGVYVIEVSNENIDLRPGDRIISVDGVKINNSMEIKNIIDEHEIGDKLNLVIQRGKLLWRLKLFSKKQRANLNKQQKAHSHHYHSCNQPIYG